MLTYINFDQIRETDLVGFFRLQSSPNVYPIIASTGTIRISGLEHIIFELSQLPLYFYVAIFLDGAELVDIGCDFVGCYASCMWDMEYRWGIYDGQLRRVWRWLWARSGSSNWSAAASLCLIFVGVINIISCPNLNYPITHSVITLLLFPRIHHIYQRLLDLDHFAQIVDFFTQLVVLVLALDQLLSWLLIIFGQQSLHSGLHFLC